MPLPDLPGLRHLLGRRGEDDDTSADPWTHEPAVHPESTLESMFAYQAERELAAGLPRQRRGSR